MREFVEEWWEIRDHVKQLLFNRYVFRTVQEIVRRNPGLQGPVRGKFSDWSQVVYWVANAVAIRRLTGEYEKNDVSLVGWLDSVSKSRPPVLWNNFVTHFPVEVEKALAAANECRSSTSEVEAFRRLLNEDRKLLIGSAAPVIPFASKRAAHHNRAVRVTTKAFHMDNAIDTIKQVAEKYDLLVFDKATDLLLEMKRRRLAPGWDEIFLEPWANRKTIGLSLGEMDPPAEGGGLRK